MIYRNPEHYEDPTAGKALENLEKEGWEYNKARYQALLRESAGMIEKMKRNGTWPTKKPKPKGSGRSFCPAAEGGSGAFAPPPPVGSERPENCPVLSCAVREALARGARANPCSFQWRTGEAPEDEGGTNVDKRKAPRETESPWRLVWSDNTQR